MLRYLVPFERFSIYSRLEAPDLKARLEKKVATGFWLFSKPIEPFTGRIFDSGFRMTPVLYNRNSFLPAIIGRFSQDGLSTRIDVHQRPTIVVIIFMTIWFSFLGSGMYSILNATSEAVEGGESSLYIGFLMMFGGYAFLNGGFWWEARHTKGYLCKLFEAKETPAGY